MNEVISWVAQHDTIVIQVVFSIVLLLVLVYVYRLFFVNSGTESSTEASLELNEVNHKLDRLLEQQKNSGIQVIEKVVPASTTVDAEAMAVANSMATATQSNNGASLAELEQAKAENTKLKAQLNELEKKVFELTPAAGTEDLAKDDGSKVDSAQVAELNKKVEELQSRLSEYDIIADDIAELSQLRSENAELKRKLENGGGSNGEGGSGGQATAVAEVSSAEEKPVIEVVPQETPVTEVQSAAEIEPLPEPAPPEPVSEPVSASIVEEKPASVLEGGIPGFDAETSALLESLVAETDAAAQEKGPAKTKTNEQVLAEAEALIGDLSQVPTTIDQSIPESEKNLMNEFEKSIQKGS